MSPLLSLASTRNNIERPRAADRGSWGNAVRPWVAPRLYAYHVDRREQDHLVDIMCAVVVMVLQFL